MDPKKLSSVPSYLPYIIVGLASLFYIYDYFIQVAPSVMTTQLMQTFSIGAAGLGVLGACFYYSYTLMQIPAGLLLDRLGPRVLLTFSVFVSACGVTLFGLTDSFFVAGLARFMIGLGSSFAFISALFLTSRWFEHRHFALIAGLVQFAGCMGSTFGEAPLAMTINHYGWRETMVTTGLITFGLSIIFWLVIRNGEQSSGFVKATTHGEWSRLMGVLKRKQVWWVGLVGLVSWVPVATIGALWGVAYLMKMYGLTNTDAGKLCSLFWIGLGIGSPVMGLMSNYLKSRCKPAIMCFGIGLMASLFIVLAHHPAIWLMGIMLFSLGWSASIQALSFGLIKDIVPPSSFGTASGINNMAAIIGGGISQPLVGVLLAYNWNGHLQNHVPVYSLHNYQHALYILPLSAVIGLFVSLFMLKETHCKPIHE